MVLALITVTPFIAQDGRHKSTAICDENINGIDTILALLATAIFWWTIPCILHVILKVGLYNSAAKSNTAGFKDSLCCEAERS